MPSTPTICVSICDEDPAAREYLYNLFTYHSEKSNLGLQVEVCPMDTVFEPDSWHFVFRGLSEVAGKS